jgi:hypothetical protein
VPKNAISSTICQFGNALREFVWDVRGNLKPKVSVSNRLPQMRLIQFKNFYAGTLLFDEGCHQGLHAVGKALAYDSHIENVLFANRQNFVLSPGLMHLVPCRFEDEGTGVQKILVPSSAKNHSHIACLI